MTAHSSACRIPFLVSGIEGRRIQSLQQKPQHVDVAARDGEVQQAGRRRRRRRRCGHSYVLHHGCYRGLMARHIRITGVIGGSTATLAVAAGFALLLLLLLLQCR